MWAVCVGIGQQQGPWAAVALLGRHLGVSPSFCTRLLVVLLGICILFTLFFSVFVLCVFSSVFLPFSLRFVVVVTPRWSSLSLQRPAAHTCSLYLDSPSPLAVAPSSHYLRGPWIHHFLARFAIICRQDLVA
jgi:hypothetical protein